jgi:hypothetical protein
MCAYTVDCLLGREAETDPAGGGLDDLKGGQRKVELDCGKGLRFLRFRLCSTMGRFLAIYKAAALPAGASWWRWRYWSAIPPEENLPARGGVGRSDSVQLAKENNKPV